MMKKKSGLLALLMVLVLILTACGGGTAPASSSTPAPSSTPASSSTPAPRPATSYTFGTASSTGVHYAVGMLFADMINKKSDYLKIFPQTTGGGEDNGVNVSKGEYEFGYWNVDSIVAAYSGDGNLHLPNLAGVMTMQAQAAHYIARIDSGIEKWEDCRGKRIGIATTNTVGEMITRAILTHYGIDWDKDLARTLVAGNDETREKLSDGDLDLIYIGGGFPISGVIELMTSGDYRLISTPKEDLEIIFKAGYVDFSFDYYSSYVIGAGTYPNQDEDVTVAGGRNLIFTRDDIPEEDVYEFLSIVHDNWDEIKQGHLAITRLDWNEMPKVGIPLHPGAERFYREKGYLK